MFSYLSDASSLFENQTSVCLSGVSVRLLWQFILSTTKIHFNETLSRDSTVKLKQIGKILFKFFTLPFSSARQAFYPSFRSHRLDFIAHVVHGVAHYHCFVFFTF